MKDEPFPDDLPLTEDYLDFGGSVGSKETQEFPSPSLPERIGSFRILEQLGQGGMGQVLLGEQTEPIQRRVAIKLIRAEKLDANRLRRFELERRALARMSHPNIAQVFEAGTRTNGQPYLVMEHVSGKPVTRYCDDLKLSLEKRLRLFIAVCEGVQHAHQKAILHRDLKPENILVAEADDGQPVPKIIDFGIAKALDGPEQTALTADVTVLGTPYYLSPESISPSADVDTRSDVYALGVILYKLLVGLLPFRGSRTLDVLKAILDEDVKKPSDLLAEQGTDWRRKEALRRGGLDPKSHLAALEGDLDWVVLKAMNRDLELRYESAGELAAEIRRYLDHLPVLAGPPSARYLISKFVRRHRLGVAAILVAALGLLAGFTARSLEASRANREAQRASQEAETSKQIADFLVSLFEVSNPASGERVDITAREILSRGSERIREDLADQPVVRARLLNLLGHVYGMLGQYQQAEPLVLEGLELRRQTLASSPFELADSLEELGQLRHWQGRNEESRDLLLEALSISEAAGDTTAVAATSMTLGGVFGDLDNFEEAERLYRQALELRMASLGADDPAVAATLNNLGNLFYDLQRWPEAEQAHLRAIAIKEKALGSEHFFLGQSLNNLGNVYVAQNRLQEAQDLHLRALAIKSNKLPKDHIEIGASHHNLGDIALARGDLSSADQRYREGLRIFQASLKPDHPYLAFSYVGLGNVHLKMGDANLAEAYFRRALGIRRAAHPASHPSIQEVVKGLAKMLREQGRDEDALALEASSGS
ncbi:MAG: serine/threonine-protein kinase [Deltaproteobacteria bacterium]|nr:serine/threonine-protein kinase [Deltaproteobacteria bacterium]